MNLDFIMNGQATGNVASTLLASGMDANALRPYIGEDGKSYVTMNVGGEPKAITTNAPATLRKDAWQQLDTAVVKVAKNRLRMVADLRSAGLTFNTNGLGTTVLQTETQSDISEATISMDGVRRSDRDRPVYDITNLPLPIIHKDFGFTARQIAASQQSGSPLDTSTAELATRRVAETAEALLQGSLPYQYGGGNIYGYTNFPDRITKVMTVPDGSNQATTVQEVLDMKNLSQLAFHYGPWMLYTSPLWDPFLDDDYSSAKGDNTLRDRLRKVEGVQDVRTADTLSGYQMILVQMTSDVAREVIGMDFTTVQWPSEGGLMLNFKVMAIMVPQLRADQNGNTGIVHGTAV